MKRSWFFDEERKPVNLIVSAVLFLVYVLTTVIDTLTVQQISVSSSILCIGALVAYFIFLRRFDPIYYLGILIFTFFAQYLGACLHFYNIIPIYDLILHSASGILLVLLAHYLLTAFFIKGVDIPLRLTLLCCFLFPLRQRAYGRFGSFPATCCSVSHRRAAVLSIR